MRCTAMILVALVASGCAPVSTMPRPDSYYDGMARERRSFGRYHIFAADRSRAYCGVEAVLLDTRTGLVPFTSAAIQSFDTQESDADTAFRETILKA